MMKTRWITGMALVALLIALPVTAGAEDGIDLAISTEGSCDVVSFSLTIAGGTAPYDIELFFGDTEFYEVVDDGSAPLIVDHTYPAHGEYDYKVKVTDFDGEESEFEGTLVIDGPNATLNSTPFPPLLTIDGGNASIAFDVDVSGGVPPYTYSWDLDQDGLPDAGLDGTTADYSYSEGGEYTASVSVTDTCGLIDVDSLTVIVDDPEDDPDEACHPTAQKIAEAVSAIFPEGRADQTYTCEDIFNFFEGGLTGYQLGFGRMWKAYQFTQAVEDLTWEEILDWKLQYSSWGALSQLNRTAEFLDEYGIRELFDMVMGEEYTVRDIRTAARNVLRYEADFEDALARMAEGANAGELGQFYRLVTALEMAPEDLDGYLADGMSLSELRHAARLSERTGATFDEVVDAKSLDHSWGEIGQAYKLADEGTSAAEILEMGVKEYRAEQRELDREERLGERVDRTAERLAEQLGWSVGDLMALFNGECEGSWSCVRKKVREQERTQGTDDRDLRTAGQLAAKYGISTEVVMAQFTACGMDWNCTRATLRDTYHKPPGKNK